MCVRIRNDVDWKYKIVRVFHCGDDSENIKTLVAYGIKEGEAESILKWNNLQRALSIYHRSVLSSSQRCHTTEPNCLLDQMDAYYIFFLLDNGQQKSSCYRFESFMNKYSDFRNHCCFHTFFHSRLFVATHEKIIKLKYMNVKCLMWLDSYACTVYTEYMYKIFNGFEMPK